MSRERTSS
jgi:hypothetical protein